MSTSTMSTVVKEQGVSWSKLLRVALLAVVASSAANIVLYLLATALFPEVGQFPMLAVPTIIMSTVAFLTVATLVFAVVARVSSQPARHFRIVAIVALLLSLGGPLSAGSGAMGMPVAPVTVVVLVLMHVIAAAITIQLFTTRAIEA